jgi:nicotinate-nucleotide adenylyltransferase
MKVGVFGGTFDPVHLGHLVLAGECRRQVGLDEVWFVPSAHHPFKPDLQVSSFDDRVAMLRLALEDRDGYVVNEIERELPAPTYTANTLDALAERYPGNEWYFLMGADALAELPLWHEPARVVARCTLLAMARPGTAKITIDQLRANLTLPADSPVRLQWVDVPPIDIASREIRRRVRAGESIQAVVPHAVEQFIQSHHLYRN